MIDIQALLAQTMIRVPQERLSTDQLLARAQYRTQCAAQRAKNNQEAREFYRQNPVAARHQREEQPEWWADNMSLQEQADD